MGIALLTAFFALSGAFATAGEAGGENRSAAAVGTDVRVGDYTAFTQTGSRLSFPVYSYANACYSYYAVIGGESYAVRENPDYNPKYVGTRTRSTHYVRYNNDNYYFSI